MIIKGVDYPLPIFLPDATRGIAKTVDSTDLENALVEGCVVNTFHLMNDPGAGFIEEQGGIKKLMGFPGLVASDSGGFQVYSLVQQDPKFGKMTDSGFLYYTGAENKRKRNYFTPEKSIQMQMSLESDIVVCFDYFTPVKPTPEEAKYSVEKTTEWAKRCREEFTKQCELRNIPPEKKPLLLAIVQGGSDKKLREKSATDLVNLGFTAFGFGGHWLNDEDKFDHDIVAYTASLLPKEAVKWGLGIGDPKAIVEGYKAGYEIFDCVLPTRDARHERLYVFTKDPDRMHILNEEKPTEHLSLGRGFFASDKKPISEFCDCLTCRRYSRAYLHYLFKVGDFTAGRLATIHNLRTYTKLIELLRKTK